MALLGRAVRALAGVTAAALIVLAPAAAQHVTEQDVKAAFLYNFTRFVEWPPGTPGSSNPFRLCVMADKAMTAVIERTMKGESVGGRQATILVPASPAEASGCQILFVASAQFEHSRSILAAVRDLPVLTVSDARGFLAHGGVIEFLLENGRVRFDISTVAAKRAGLTISSRLLQVARLVDGEPPR